jgi:hypothetical protein
VTTTIRHPPSVGQALWPLVAPQRTALNARTPLPSKWVEQGQDCLIVQVGPAAPYRLLVLHPDPDGLIHIRLWELRHKRVEEVVSERCLSDLVGEVLRRITINFNLSG